MTDKDMLIAKVSLDGLFERLRVDAIETTRNELCSKCKEFDTCNKPCGEARNMVRHLVSRYFSTLARFN